MAKPLMVMLHTDGADEEKLVKQVPEARIFEQHATCRELLEYMLDPNTDEWNPEPYSAPEAELATRLLTQYRQSLKDRSRHMTLMAVNAGGGNVPLDLGNCVEEYMQPGPNSILLSRVLSEAGRSEPYSSIDMHVSDTSTAGWKRL